MPLNPAKPLPKRPRLPDEAYRGCQRYSITIATNQRTHVFTHAAIFDAMRSILKVAAEKTGFRVWVFCFMPDHLHLLIEGIAAKSDAQQFMKQFKQQSGFWYKQHTRQKLWATSYFDHVLRKEEDTVAVIKYILANPECGGLARHWYEYPYSGSLELDVKDLL